MVTDFFEKYTKVQALIEEGLQEQAALKAQKQKLDHRLLTLAIGRRFQRAGVTRHKAGWYVGDDGKLAKDA